MNLFFKCFIQAGLIIAALIPFGVFLVISTMIAPVGFWQVFAVWAGGIIVLGAFQGGFILAMLTYSITLWAKKKQPIGK
jgi:prolipoprotein diacylglyceryltransferase